MIRFLAALWLAVLFAALPAHAQTFPERGRAPVVDQAELLTPAQEAELTAKLEGLYKQHGRQFVIATVKTLDGMPIEDYGVRLGRYWKIGDERLDDGVVLVVAPNERQVTIATGYGAGAYLTDLVSARIIRNDIVPRFREEPPDYFGGISAAADQVITMMELPPEEAARRAQEIGEAETKRSERRDRDINPMPVIFIVVIFFIIIGQLSRRAGGRRYRRRDSGISPWVILWGLDALSRSGRRGGGWGGGSWGGGGGSWGGGGGGGFGGFSGGGGSFGGGGASGGW